MHCVETIKDIAYDHYKYVMLRAASNCPYCAIICMQGCALLHNNNMLAMFTMTTTDVPIAYVVVLLHIAMFSEAFSYHAPDKKR